MTLPSDYAEVQSHRNLKRLLNDQVDMQFEDLRGLLRLPQPGTGLETGFNLTAATIMLNLVAGSSVCFYQASVEGLSRRSERTKRFKDVIRDFYYDPEVEVMSPSELADALYDSVRNPLVHALGLETPPAQTAGELVYLVKSPLSEVEVSDLESYPSRPARLASIPTAVRQERADEGSELTIHISALYWGLHRMLHRLFADPVQVDNAERLAGVLVRRLDKYLTLPAHVGDTLGVADRLDVEIQNPNAPGQSSCT